MHQSFPFRLLLLSITLTGAVLWFFPPWESSELDGEELVIITNPDTLEGFSISKSIATNEPPAQLNFSRNPDASWSAGVPDSNPVPVHAPLMDKLFSELGQKWTHIPSPPDPKSTNGQSILSDMGLLNPAVTMTLNPGSPTRSSRLLVGNKLEGKDFYYVSDDGYSTIAMAPSQLVSLLAQNINFWRKRQIIDFDDFAFDGIRVTSVNGRVELKKSDPDTQWMMTIPAQEPADSVEIERRLDFLEKINAIEFREADDEFEAQFALRLDFLHEGSIDHSFEWRLIQRPEDDPAEEGAPPLFLLTRIQDDTRAIVTGEALSLWALEPNGFRNRQLLTFSESEVQKADIQIINQNPFSFEKEKDSDQWQIRLEGNENLIPAHQEKITSFIRLSSMMRIHQFPDLPWIEAPQSGLSPAIATYTFYDSLGTDADSLGGLRLGRLDQESQSIFASPVGTDVIYAIRAVDGLSMPQNYFSFRSPTLFPGVDPDVSITSLNWVSPVGEIAFLKSEDGASWKNLGEFESNVLDEFSKQIRNFIFSEWRGFGPKLLKNYNIHMDKTMSSGLTLTLSDDSTHTIWFGKFSPRRGKYAAIQFHDGIYIFDFSRELIESITSIDEMKIYFGL